MKLIVGLGNPDGKYQKTRHNIGFMVVGAIAKKLELSDWLNDKRFESEIVKTDINGDKILLVKPQTFMNASGKAVKTLAEYYDIDSEGIIVISDDINLAVGDVRTRLGGTAGGHNGLKSVIDNIGEAFWRVRIGVGMNENEPSEQYVLKQLSDQEAELFEDIVDKTAQYLIDLDFGGLRDETVNIK